MHPKINEERLWGSLMTLAEVGATAGGGVCRLALSDEDRRARDLFVRWCQDAGCVVRVDAVGNIFARRTGRNDALPPVVTGSHIDTQPNGGRFDGAYGVMAGLEVLRTLNDVGIVTEAPLIREPQRRSSFILGCIRCSLCFGQNTGTASA